MPVSPDRVNGYRRPTLLSSILDIILILLDHLRSPFCFPLLLGQTLNFFADHLHSLCLLHLPLPPHDLTNHILSQTPMWSMRPTQEIALCLRYARNG
jgi:hypothetical protein